MDAPADEATGGGDSADGGGGRDLAAGAAESAASLDGDGRLNGALSEAAAPIATAPKRARSAYFVFTAVTRAQLIDEHPGGWEVAL